MLTGNNEKRAVLLLLTRLLIGCDAREQSGIRHVHFGDVKTALTVAWRADAVSSIVCLTAKEQNSTSDGDGMA